MIRRCTEKDREAVLNFASERAGENLFIIGDIESFGIDSEKVSTWIEEIDGQMEGIYLKYRDNFVIYSKNQRFDPKEVADLIKLNHTKNINCLKETADHLGPFLKEDYHMSDCFYCILKNGDRLDAISNECEDAKIEDTAELAMKLSMIPEFAHSKASALESVQNYFTEPDRINIIMRINGEIAGSATTAVQSSSAAMIGTVFTVEKYRNRHVASKIVSTICHRVIEKNKECVLFYDNPKAGSIYHRLGFKTIDKWCLFRIKQG